MRGNESVRGNRLRLWFAPAILFDQTPFYATPTMGWLILNAPRTAPLNSLVPRVDLLGSPVPPLSDCTQIPLDFGRQAVETNLWFTLNVPDLQPFNSASYRPLVLDLQDYAFQSVVVAYLPPQAGDATNDQYVGWLSLDVGGEP